MEESKASLNEKTTIQLWPVLATVPFVIGGVFWLSTIYLGEQANANQIVEVKAHVEYQRVLLEDIRTRLIRIEDKQNKNK